MSDEGRKNFRWPDKMIKRCAELRGAGMTMGDIARQISSEFGVTVERASVVGVMHRNKDLITVTGPTRKGGPALGWSGWSDDAIKRCTELYKAGLSGSMIAERINREFGMRKTRNAVIGVLNRRGLRIDGDKDARGNGVRANKKHKPYDASKRGVSGREARPPLLRLASEPLPAVEQVPEKLYTLEDRPAGGCTWVYGDPPFTRCYCGRPAVEGLSVQWCETHVRRGLHAPEVKSRRQSATFAAKQAKQFA